MYFDEDGDLAHEFYEEVRTSNGTEMKQKPREQLTPQVLLQHQISIGYFCFLLKGPIGNAM